MGHAREVKTIRVSVLVLSFVSIGLLAVMLLAMASPSILAALVTIQYAVWGGPAQIAVEQEIVAAFEAQHPDIKVEIVSGFSSNEALERMVTLHAAGLAPDLMRLDSYYFAEVAEAGMLLPIDDLISRTPELDMSLYIPVALEDVRYNGETFG